MKPVPQIPPMVSIVTPDGKQTMELAIYLQKLEAAVKELQELVAGYHP